MSYLVLCEYLLLLLVFENVLNTMIKVRCITKALFLTFGKRFIDFNQNMFFSN